MFKQNIFLKIFCVCSLYIVTYIRLNIFIFFLNALKLTRIINNFTSINDRDFFFETRCTQLFIMSYLINSLLICAWFLLSSISLLEAVDCGVYPAYCDSSSVLYQIDGSCNNLLHPEYGTPNTTYDRLLPAQYGDGIKSPRKSTTGADLPNARSIRLNCLPHDKLILETTLTRIAVAVGQFAAHDISRQVLNAPVDACCTCDMKPLTNPPDYCAAVELCPDDPVFGELCATCMPAQCSKTNHDYQCSLTPQAEQITETTGYLDLSDVYSESAAKLNQLRSYQDGKLILVVRNDYPYLQIDPSNENCYIPQGSTDQCLLSGDPAVNQNPSLSIINTMWFREHNRLCDKLKYYNPCWNDEKLFQTARRINIAIHQWMIYFEYLPLILGSITVQTNGIAPISLGYNSDYDATVKVNPFNEFSHAAFRVLHPLIRGTVHLRDEARKDAGAAYLPDHMEHTQEFIEHCDNFDSIVRGDSYGNAFKNGRYQDFIVSNSLFLRKFKHNLDLIVLDIVRGRCNGHPSYNDLLEYCGYPRASTFDDLLNYMDAEDIAALSGIYVNVNDVELIVGMRNEKRLGEGIVGPVARCILIKQFQRTRRGDRLFFEHPEAKFNLLQLTSIRLSSKLSTFLCNNGNNIKTMQPNAFEDPSLLNQPVPCELLPQLDVSLWKDYSCI